MHTMYNFFYCFSEKKSFTVYTFDNISTYNMFPNKLNFKLKVGGSSSNGYINIFLMASNPNIMLGNMYYIQLQKDYDHNYSNRYGHRRNRIRSCTLRKCTADHSGHVTIHGQSRYGCDIITNNVSKSVNFKLWVNLIFFLLEVMCPDKFII